MSNRLGYLRVNGPLFVFAWFCLAAVGWSQHHSSTPGATEADIAHQLKSASTPAEQMRAIDDALARQAVSLNVRSALHDLSNQSRSPSVRASARRALIRLQTLAPAVNDSHEESSHVLALRELKIPEEVEVVDDPTESGERTHREIAQAAVLTRTNPRTTDVACIEKQAAPGSILPVAARDHSTKKNQVMPASEAVEAETIIVDPLDCPCECPDPNMPAEVPAKRKLNRVRQTIGALVRRPAEIMKKSDPQVEWTEGEVVETEVVENPPLSAIASETAQTVDPPVGALPPMTRHAKAPPAVPNSTPVDVAGTTSSPTTTATNPSEKSGLPSGAFPPVQAPPTRLEAFAGMTHVARKPPASAGSAPRLKSPLTANEEFPSIAGQTSTANPPAALQEEVVTKPIPKAIPPATPANTPIPTPTTQVVARKTPLVAPIPPNGIPTASSNGFPTASPDSRSPDPVSKPATTPMMALENIPRDPKARTAKAREMLTQGKELARAGDWTQAEQILLQVRELAVEYRKWQYSPGDLEQDILAAQAKVSPLKP